MEGRRFTAILVIIPEHRARIDVIVLKRDELTFRRGAEADTLLGVGAMTGRLKRHLAAKHELDRFVYLPRRRRRQRASVHGQSLLPKPEPTNLVMTRTFSLGKRNICASTLRMLKTACNSS